MPKLNMSQAARAAGKSRKTLYRHIDAGKLSVEKDATDNPVIDVSELQRVYGELKLDVTGDTVGQNRDMPHVATEGAQHEIKLLKLRLEMVERERDTERERREQSDEERHRLLAIIETQSKQLAAPKETTEDQPQPQPSFWGRLFGNRR
jgi:hypothetical protein